MLPTVLRRWTCFFFYIYDFFSILCGFVGFTMEHVILSLSLLFVFVLFQSCLASGKESCLFVARAFVCLFCTR